MIPEHTDVEVDEPVDEPTVEAHTHAHMHDRPSAHDVILAAVAQALPCPVCGRTEPCRCVRPQDYSPTAERASLIEKALILYGHLPEPEGEAPVFDAEETAQWLADRSGFARYTQVHEGWRRLTEAEADVELATVYALRRVPTDEVEMVKAAKAALLAWHQSGKV